MGMDAWIMADKDDLHYEIAELRNYEELNNWMCSLWALKNDAYPWDANCKLLELSPYMMQETLGWLRPHLDKCKDTNLDEEEREMWTDTTKALFSAAHASMEGDWTISYYVWW